MNTRHRSLFRLVVEKNPERTFTQQEAELILGLSKPGKRVMKTYPPPEKKAIPAFQNDEDAEQFIATADLSEYDLSGGTVVHFEIHKHRYPKKADDTGIYRHIQRRSVFGWCLNLRNETE